MKKSTIIILCVVLLAVGVAFGYYYESIKTNIAASWKDTTETACTLEAKLCPDGSTVGRSGPRCEFATCPGALATSTTEKTSAAATTTKTIESAWKHYTHAGLNYSFDYPRTWETFESPEEQFPGTRVQPQNPQLNLDDRFSSPYIYFDVSVNDRTIDAVRGQYAGKAKASEITITERTTTVDGHKAYVFGYSTDKANVRNIYIPYGGKMYTLQTERYDLAEVKTMIDTFSIK